MPRLKGNDQAPHIAMQDLKDDPFDLYAILGSGRPVVLAFLRYIGCPVCQMRFWELDARREEYEKAGSELVAVVQSRPETLLKHRVKKPYSLRVLADPEGRIFEVFGVGRASLAEYLAPAAFGKVLKATFSGYMHGRFEGNERQKPAELIIDTDGRILLAHYGKHIADHLTDAELLGALRGLQQKRTSS